MHRLVPLLFAYGCHTESVCTHAPEPVGDDDPTDLGVTAAEVFAGAGGLYQTTGRYEDETETLVAIDVTRGNGAATFLRAAWEERRVPGLSRGQNLMTVYCEDTLQVPVQLAVTTPDGVVSLDEPAELVTTNLVMQPGESAIHLEVPADQLAGVPVPDGVDPDYGFAQSWFQDGEITRGDLGYGGQDENSAWARYVLSW